MKTIIILAAASVSLAACGSAEETEEPAEPVDATLESTAMGDLSGTYEIAMADGTVILQTINADGTYVETTPEGARTGGGAWRLGDEGRMCFDPEGDEGEECYAGGAPGEDGAFELRGEDGEVQSSVRRIDAEIAQVSDETESAATE
ncbi:MAG: hypothetical protein JJ901_10245 [Erythrobacter sp.]|uniref:hypothetical protein n=1 Tax=Erythrobacter sp. TaxID=1042 RepID=UPI001B2766D4|nr:hypothetical protein [Erythrobacter sp.]MBO6768662.1 hypothetical protein [Erythrobacter sp.]